MAVTMAKNPNESIDDSPHEYIGLSSDTKPTTTSHAGLAKPASGFTFWEYDTDIIYKTRDGDNWDKYQPV